LPEGQHEDANGLLEVDVQQHMEAGDAAMVAEIRQEVEGFLKKQIEDQKDWLGGRFVQFEVQTSKQLSQIEGIINSKAMDTGHFNMALKQEMEEIGAKHRKQTFESLSVIKDLTKTVKNLKENNKYFKENDMHMKDLLRQVVEYFNYVNQMLNTTGEDNAESMNDAGKSTMVTMIGGRATNEKFRANRSSMNRSELTTKGRPIDERAADALKRLHISLFRSYQSANKLRGSDVGSFMELTKEVNNKFMNSGGKSPLGQKPFKTIHGTSRSSLAMPEGVRAGTQSQSYNVDTRNRGPGDPSTKPNQA